MAPRLTAETRATYNLVLDHAGKGKITLDGHVWRVARLDRILYASNLSHQQLDADLVVLQEAGLYSSSLGLVRDTR